MKRILVKIPKLEARNSRDVFALFSALNAMGYDDENNPAGMSPMRKKVRKILGQCDWAGRYPRLQREAKMGQPWWALNAMLAKTKNIKKSSRIGRLFSDLAKFSKEPAVRRIWPIYEAQQNKENRKLTHLLKREVPRLTAFIGQPAGVKKVIFIANPLDAYWRGYVFGTAVGFWRGPAETGYVVAGPCAKERQIELLIRHELLHIIAPPFRLPRKIIGRRSKRLTKMGYTTLRIINREYVIRAINLLYESGVLEKDILRAVRKEQKDFPHIREAIEFVAKKIKNP